MFEHYSWIFGTQKRLVFLFNIEKIWLRAGWRKTEGFSNNVFLRCLEATCFFLSFFLLRSIPMFRFILHLHRKWWFRRHQNLDKVFCCQSKKSNQKQETKKNWSDFNTVQTMDLKQKIIPRLHGRRIALSYPKFGCFVYAHFDQKIRLVLVNSIFHIWSLDEMYCCCRDMLPLPTDLGNRIFMWTLASR